MSAVEQAAQAAEIGAGRAFLVPGPAWSTVRKGPLTIHRAGHGLDLDALAALLRDCREPAGIGRFLRRQIGHFAAIVEGPDFLLALVDTIRSYPLFHAAAPGRLIVSNCARTAGREAGAASPDEEALLDLAMAGYATGGATARRGLRQLQAGELLLAGNNGAEPVLHTYYRYLPREQRVDESSLMERLAATTDRMFRRAMENAGGGTIWVPLSGGLDSRLVVCKLKELGYDRLRTFSYGPDGNFEAGAARHVADTIGVPWEFVSTPAGPARRAFASPERARYQEMADGLCSVPVYNEYFVLARLRDQGRFRDGDVVVNGQSGDFLTGGHIPAGLLGPEPTVRMVLDALVAKHFSVWRHLKTPGNLARVEERLLAALGCGLSDRLDAEELAARYESWEWRERQCKYVVNGQRMYDFLGLGWQLPLWDPEYMDFWQDVPMRLRFGQAFFRRYLEGYDYKGLFRGYASESRRWPGRVGLAVKAVDKALTLLRMEGAKRAFLRNASYFGHYSNQYRLHGFRRFLDVIPLATVPPQARGVVALNIHAWFRENGFEGRLLDREKGSP